MRTIIAITGASGSAFGIEFLRKCPGEKILILSKWGKSVLAQETGLSPDDVIKLADNVYSADDLNAPIASGSNPFDQYVILPCSMTTLGRLANGIGENLIARVGEVALKENRRMLLGIRETPLSAVALKNALTLSQLGVTIMPISPPFYFKQQSLDEMVKAFVSHTLSTLNIPHDRTGWRQKELQN